MKYVMTLLWSLILGVVLSYVISSMNSISFDIATASLFGVIIFILVTLIGTVAYSPQPKTEK